MKKIECYCGEVIELDQNDIDNFCAIECPACGTDVEYDFSNYVNGDLLEMLK